jgi:hypothetical protein
MARVGESSVKRLAEGAASGTPAAPQQFARYRVSRDAHRNVFQTRRDRIRHLRAFG